MKSFRNVVLRTNWNKYLICRTKMTKTERKNNNNKTKNKWLKQTKNVIKNLIQNINTYYNHN